MIRQYFLTNQCAIIYSGRTCSLIIGYTYTLPDHWLHLHICSLITGYIFRLLFSDHWSHPHTCFLPLVTPADGCSQITGCTYSVPRSLVTPTYCCSLITGYSVRLFLITGNTAGSVGWETGHVGIQLLWKW